MEADAISSGVGMDTALLRVDPPVRQPPVWQGFGLSAVSPMIAAAFSNPMDVARVRMQLQGSASAGAGAGAAGNGASGRVVYRSTFHVLTHLSKTEGLRGLERGLTTALWREGSKNFFRLGLFKPILESLHDPATGPAPLHARLAASFVSGVVGAFVCNPFELVKTRLQAGGGSGFMQGFGMVWRDGGVAGLFRNAETNMLRSAIGTPVLLTSYTYFKQWALGAGFPDSTPTHLMNSALAAFACQLFMNPVDIVRTRLYNQPKGPDGKGLHYRNFGDALRSLLAKEGVKGLFKGLFPGFMRLGPHIMITFVVMEKLRKELGKRDRAKALEQESARVFNELDLNKNGYLQVSELRTAFFNACPRQAVTGLSDEAYQAAIKADVDRYVAAADTNNDGQVDLTEFRSSLSELRAAARRYDLQHVFASIDTDGNGRLDEEEIMAALRHGTHYASRGADSSMLMSKEQFERKLRQDVRRAIKMVDDDGDGHVDFEEFIKMTGHFEDLRRGAVLDEWVKASHIGGE